MIVKTVQFRNNLKKLLEGVYSGEEIDELVLEYYGKYFKIVPMKPEEDSDNLTKTQKLVNYFRGRKRSKFADSEIFNEEDPAQEKANFRDLRYGRYLEK